MVWTVMKKLVCYEAMYFAKWEVFGLSQLDNIKFKSMFVFADLRDIELG
jgi:hypothetical protein